MIDGKLLMIAVEVNGTYETIAMAKSCSLDMSTSLSDVKTKDDNELAVDQEVTGMSWSMKTENLIPASKNGIKLHPDTLLNLLCAGTRCNVQFRYYTGAAGRATGSDHSWGSTANTVLFRGTAIIESISLNGTNKENATFSASFKGAGAPEVLQQLTIDNRA